MRYKICKHCDSDFIPANAGQKYCSVLCADRAAVLVKKAYRMQKATRLKNALKAATWKKNNYLKTRLEAVKHRAIKQGLIFSLTENDFTVPEVCPVLGIPMDGRDKNHQWSFDRLVPEKGYVQGNVRIISMKANRIKNNATLEDLEKLVEYLKKELQ